MSSFQKIAVKSDLPPGKMKEYKIADKTIVVANAGSEYFAFDGICTHEHCALAGGYLDDHTLTCYCHGAQFDITSGKVLSPPAPSPINIYPVKLEGDDILVEI